MPAVTGNNFYIDSHDLHFRTGTTNVASISYDTSDDSISLNTAGTGAINIGDAGGDLFIGDGTSETDIVFEQNGAIRGLTNKTLTLGQTDSNVTIAAQNFTISGTGVVTDMSGRLQVQTIEATDNATAGWAGTDNQFGTIYMSDEGRGLLGNMGGGYARPLIQGGSNAVTIGSNGTSAIRDVNVYAGNGAGSAMSNFNVFTSGVKRMTITRTGNIGFGGGDADNPHQPFVFDAQGGRMDLLNGSLKIRYVPNNDAITITASVGNEGRILAYDGDTSSPHPLLIAADRIRFSTSGAGSHEVMRITSDGKVGIGTDDPNAFLDVSRDNSNAGNQFVVADTEGASAAKRTYTVSDPAGLILNHYYAEAGSSNEYARYSDFVSNISNGAGSKMRFITKNAANTYFTGILIDNSGKVGIGTDDPGAKLHAEGSMLVKGDSSWAGTDNNNAAIYMNTNGRGLHGVFSSSYARNLIQANNNYIEIGNQGTSLIYGFKFYAGSETSSVGTYNFYTSGTNSRLHIAKDGSVGIGSANPVQKLDVAGVIRSSVTSRIQADVYNNSANSANIIYRSSTNTIVGNNANALVVEDGGQVGIGTDNAGATLDLRGNMRLDSAGNTDRHIYFRNQATVAKVRSDAALQFDVGVSASPTLAMYIEEDTKTVGIGTDAPRSGKLHIYNTNAVSDGDGSASMNPTGQDSIVLYTQGGPNKNFGSISWLDGGRRRAMIAAAAEKSDGDYQGLSFFTRGTDGPGDLYESMRINHGGTIGMGTTGAGGFHANAERLVVGDGAGNEGITIYAGASSAGSLYFADGTAGDAAYRGSVQYSHSAEKLFLGAGGGTQMTLTNTSLVGIGTQSPDKQLTLRKAEPYLRLEESDSGGNKRLDLFVSNSTGVIAANQSAQTMMFQTVGTTRMTIEPGGDVGIGTTNPTEKLHVVGDILIDAGTTNSNTGELAFTTQYNTAFLRSSYTDPSANTETYLAFHANTAGEGNGTVAEQMRIAGNKVGIGTDDPPQKLSVKGTIVHVNDSDVQVVGITNSNGHGRIYANQSAGVTKVLLDSNGDSYLNGGDVGIGTNNPTEKLDVVGFIRMGNATANSTQKIARQVVRAYNTSHNDFMAFMGTANQTSNVVSYGGGSSDQTCATELSFFTHTNVSTSTAGTKRARINLSGNFSLGADKYLETHNTARAHIQAQGTSVDLSSTKISDATLLLGNEYGATNSSNMANAYGLAIGVNTNGRSLLQSRRFNGSVFFDMALQPYGGNVGIGTDAPGYKLEVNGSIVGTSKSFIIDHPTQTGKKLMHACIEGPENGVYYRGRSQETGIEAPEYWSGLVDINSMTVDVTPIGPNQSIYVERIDDNGDICVGSNTAEPLNYFYVVYGERKDIDKLEIVRDPTPPPSGADVAQ